MATSPAASKLSRRCVWWLSTDIQRPFDVSASIAAASLEAEKEPNASARHRVQHRKLIQIGAHRHHAAIWLLSSDTSKGGVMPALSPIWGPYYGADDARAKLSQFVDRACGSGVGIAWAAGGHVYPLRAPAVFGGGLRDIAAFQWSPAPPPPPKPPVGFWPRVWSGLQWCVEQQNRAAMQEMQTNQAMAQGMNQVLSRILQTHRDDGVGVALDVLAVGLSLALLPTGLGALGLLGLIGGGILLTADGAAYGMELAGEDDIAEHIKQRTEYLRIAGTLLTLPDIGWNGFKMVNEMREIQAMRALDRTKAVAVEGMAARSANAARAERFRQIAERAHLRAQIRSEQLAALFRLEVSGRAAGTGSAGLLMREEWLNNESAAHMIARRLQIHTTSVHR